MHQPQILMTVIAMAGIVVVVFLFMAIWATRYVKGGPNKVLVVSGRKVRLPDGSVAGYRIVKGGGTFVVPIIERVDTLSLEVIKLELSQVKVRTGKGEMLSVDGVLQFRINGDDRSIAAAAEQLLSKSEQEIKSIVQLVMEKHLGAAAAGASAQELNQNADAYVGRVQAAAATDLNAMGLGIVSVAIREIRAA